MELKTDNQCDGTRALWGEGGYTCSLCDWCDCVIQERPQPPAFMAGNSINCQVSYVLSKLSSHLCECTHFIQSLTSVKVSYCAVFFTCML